MLRTFGAIGDIHAEDELLEAAIEHLHALGSDAILAVGDIVDGRGDLARTVKLLRDHRITCVRGNHERWFLEGHARGLPHAHLRAEVDRETVNWLAALPPTWTAETVMGTLLLCHAVGDDDMIRLLPDDDASALAANEPLQRVLGSGVEIMVCGHTHQPMVRTLFGLLVVNAGTLASTPGFVHVDLERKAAQLFSLDGGVRLRETLRFGAPGDDVWGAF